MAYAEGTLASDVIADYRVARATDGMAPRGEKETDGQRAMRVIRTRADEWNLDPKRIGILGFSAGGEVVAMVVYSSTAGDAAAARPA